MRELLERGLRGGTERRAKHEVLGWVPRERHLRESHQVSARDGGLAGAADHHRGVGGQIADRVVHLGEGKTQHDHTISLPHLCLALSARPAPPPRAPVWSRRRSGPGSCSRASALKSGRARPRSPTRSAGRAPPPTAPLGASKPPSPTRTAGSRPRSKRSCSTCGLTRCDQRLACCSSVAWHCSCVKPIPACWSPVVFASCRGRQVPDQLIGRRGRWGALSRTTRIGYSD